MTEKEMIKTCIEEFSRLQDYMEACEKESAAYKIMYKRYIDLKTFLEISGVNLEEINRIKE